MIVIKSPGVFYREAYKSRLLRRGKVGVIEKIFEIEFKVYVCLYHRFLEK